MLRFLFPSVIALYCSAVLVNGKCASPGCQGSASATDQGNLTVLEDHDDNLQLTDKNSFSAIEQLAKALEENDKKLKQIDQRLVKILLEQDKKLEKTNDIMSTKLDMLQAANYEISDQVMEHDRRLQTMQENFSSAIENLSEKLNAVLVPATEGIKILQTQDCCRGNPEVCDCSTIKANGYTSSGVYRIYVEYQNKRYYANAYCDMTTSNGAWTIFQRRKDGSVDFYRGWNDYANGFGDPSGEFWLGNDFIHLLTSKKIYRLRIDLEDFDGGNRYAEYSTFNISSSADKYKLTLTGYSGNAGDSLTQWHSGRNFTTKDADNDERLNGNCAQHRQGAYWYQDCTDSNLNGVYLNGPFSSGDREGITWYGWRGPQYSLKTVEMKIL